MVVKVEFYWIDIAKVTFVQCVIIWSYECFMFVLKLEETKGGFIKVWLMTLIDYFSLMRTSPWRR
jgi:hypothetical protein